jgi:DnaJ domain
MVVKTHYDNLKVARNAPDDVIRAAYRSLIEKYHPSRNPGAEAARITKILDEAFETLTDPLRRKNHDQWIAREEQRSAMEQASSSAQPSPAPRSFLKSINASFKDVTGSLMVMARMNGERLLLGMLLVGVLGYFALQGRNESPNNDAPLSAQPYNASPIPLRGALPPVNVAPVVAPTLAQHYNASPAWVSASVTVPVVPPKSVYQRPAHCPQVSPWPTTSSYVKGYPERATNGHSRVLVDNKRGDSDVLVKIVSTDGPTAFPVRVFYVTAHGEFTAHGLPPGIYDIRFCTLANGALSRSESFTLKMIPDADGGGATAMGYALTLYTVPNGNVQMHPLNPADF